ncbi:hypothetical protein L484_006449 [Morus notabilis]|uniref:Secreted protein n=1 Tax=Morus notabilis TaxID=981085 RepID=W9SFU7_9ROSA|nr:hypothetical protein L484_006449 [Morus notabilis]
MWIRLGLLFYPVALSQVRTLLQRQLRMCSQLKKRTLGNKTIVRRGNPSINKSSKTKEDKTKGHLECCKWE